MIILQIHPSMEYLGDHGLRLCEGGHSKQCHIFPSLRGHLGTTVRPTVGVMNQGIGPQWTYTKPPCYKGNKCRTHPFGFPTDLGPEGPRENHAVTVQFKPQSVGTSPIKYGKVVPQSDNQVINLLRKRGTTFKRINQHTQESHASHCDITHAKWHHFYMN